MYGTVSKKNQPKSKIYSSGWNTKQTNRSIGTKIAKVCVFLGPKDASIDRIESRNQATRGAPIRDTEVRNKRNSVMKAYGPCSTLVLQEARLAAL